jgi:hypothetical protein
MVISFTGAGSTGKSSLLKLCKQEFGDNFTYVEEVTRLVKRQYNVPINEQAGDMTQLLILNQHLTNSFIKGDVIMDRCIVDGLIYTHWLYKHGKVSTWVHDYAWRLVSLLINKVDIFFYCSADFDLVDDGERSTSTDFRNDIAQQIDSYLNNYCKPEQIVKLSGSIEQRMHTIKETLKQYGTNPTR